jgi:hypothetical protein
MAKVVDAPAPDATRSKQDSLVQKIFDEKAEKGEDGSVREVMIPLADIVEKSDGLPGSFDVRVDSIVPENVEHFFGLFKQSANPDIDPIYLEYRTDKDGKVYFVLVDGRHRTYAARKAGLEFIRAVIFYGLTFNEKRILATNDGTQQGLGLSVKDIAMNVFDYMKRDVASSVIREYLSNVPKTELEKAMRMSNKAFGEFKMNKALDAYSNAVGKGLLIDPRQIAIDNGVNPKRLQKELLRKKKGLPKGRGENPLNAAGSVANEFRDFSKYLDKISGEMIQHTKTGAVPADNVANLFKRMYAQINGLTERVRLAENKLRSLQYEADEE